MTKSKVGNFDWGDTLAPAHIEYSLEVARNNALAPTRLPPNPMSKQAPADECRRNARSLRAARVATTAHDKPTPRGGNRDAEKRAARHETGNQPGDSGPERQRPRAGRGSVIKVARPRPAKRA